MCHNQYSPQFLSDNQIQLKVQLSPVTTKYDTPHYSLKFLILCKRVGCE